MRAREPWCWKSIFEEQILREAASLDRMEGYGDAGEYLERYLGDAYKGEFLQLVQGAAATGVPAIASINCIGAGDAWIEYAEAMQAAGAVALELNVFLLPTDRHAGAQEARTGLCRHRAEGRCGGDGPRVGQGCRCV